MRAALEQESPLWIWEGEDLVVQFYCVEAEQSYKSKRESGQRGGRKKAENLARAKAHAKADALATKSNPTQIHETRGDLTQHNSTESPPGEPASPEERDSLLKALQEVGGKGLVRDVGAGSGAAVTLEDLFSLINY